MRQGGRFQRAIERRKRKVFLYREGQIGCVVDCQLLLARQIKKNLFIRVGHCFNSQFCDLLQENRSTGRRYAAAALSADQDLPDLIPPNRWYKCLSRFCF